MTDQLAATKPADVHEVDVRALARNGQLATYYQSVVGHRRRAVMAAVYEIVAPIVFERLTRKIELRRRHYGCAVSIRGLEPDCLDRYHDDVEAVIDDLFRRAQIPITNLEAWVVGRMEAATVDAHRRRRGAVGALQRPRVPNWLVDALGDDPWLVELATAMLVWVGNSVTAGADVWPIQSWAERRARMTGEHRAATQATSADVQCVLAAMRRRPAWYDAYVERPLGRKVAPVAMQREESDKPPTPLLLSEPYDTDDAELRALATVAMEAITDRVHAGDDPSAAVTEVLSTVFKPTRIGTHDLEPPRHDAIGNIDELIADKAVVGRVVTTVLDTIGSGQGEPQRQSSSGGLALATTTPELGNTVIGRWYRRLSSNPSAKRSHWRTKT
ncbi:hypothetical protein ABZS66_43410, partial [Dactylosporangium sp. NPDC005572]|uniref:hypothetical protein n=1 Tax=Dactylosporangium sp. NPDC005572 TaxID=3156889 RepID=UPI0033AB112B